MIFGNELIKRLKSAKNISILTGAGVSAESGISTFRDKDGLWSKFNPMELASMDGFMQNSARVWEWYQYRRKILQEASPNAGHYAIAEMEKIVEHFTLITQNVDRLHQAAGSQNVLELHGNILENRCFSCDQPYIEEICPENVEMPKCNHCGGKIRPCVVWFGEMLPQKALQQAEIAAMKSDVFFSIGTAAEVYPAASLPIIAKDYGAYLIEINPNTTSISNFADSYISAKSGDAMPLILHLLRQI